MHRTRQDQAAPILHGDERAHSAQPLSANHPHEFERETFAGWLPVLGLCGLEAFALINLNVPQLDRPSKQHVSDVRENAAPSLWSRLRSRFRFRPKAG